MGQRADFRQMATDIAASFGDVPESGTYRVRAVTSVGLGGPVYGSNADQALSFFVLAFGEDERFEEPILAGDWKAGFPGSALTSAPAANALILRADGSAWSI